MAQQANKQPNCCKCIGDKRAKTLEKKMAELKDELSKMQKEILTLRKVLHR